MAEAIGHWHIDSLEAQEHYLGRVRRRTELTQNVSAANRRPKEPIKLRR